MGYTITHHQGMSDKVYRQYLDLQTRFLLQQGASVESVPRTTDNGNGRWLYVWNNEDAARAFAEELRRYTEDEGWDLREVGEEPQQGPLRPIVLELGWESTGYVFGLAPLTERVIRRRFPDSRLYYQIVVQYPPRVPTPPDAEELRYLAPQVLPLLTGLSTEQVAALGGFEVIDPVTHEVLLPVGGQPVPAGGNGLVRA